MAQLIVRNIEDDIVDLLKKRAAEAGVSAEEEHRRILRNELKARAFGEHILAFPQIDADVDWAFERQPGTSHRNIDW